MSDDPNEPDERKGDARDREEGAMTDEGAADTGAEHATEPEKEMGSTVRDVEHERTTAPQSPYTGRQVGTGFLVLLVGLLVTFAIPLLLA